MTPAARKLLATSLCVLSVVLVVVATFASWTMFLVAGVTYILFVVTARAVREYHDKPHSERDQ